MTLRRVPIAVAMACAGALMAPRPAAASLHLCNQTSYVLYVALGAATRTELDTQGWTRVVPGDCATPLQGPLSAPAYFIYARTSQAHAGEGRAWGGKVQICAKETNFSQRIPLPTHGCKGEDFFPLPFAVLDRHGLKTWRTTFTESKQIASRGAARDAGLDRLLADAGYHAAPGKQGREAALQAFRARMKLPSDATDTDLFDALETEAMKAAAPAGYSVCNDTDSAVWAAIGLQKEKSFVTRGWWQIPAGGCARTVTEPLKTDRVYLLAEHKPKRVLVSGPMKLCVADIEFEVNGRGRCGERGLSEAGFAVTDTKGRSGYVAHVGDDGLLPPAPSAHGTPSAQAPASKRGAAPPRKASTAK